MTSAERREQLIEVATQVFASEGADRASVESIASRAGVSKPVIYEHFGSKDGLYAVVVDRHVRLLQDGLRCAQQVSSWTSPHHGGCRHGAVGLHR